jgi:hypothetical protein
MEFVIPEYSDKNINYLLSATNMWYGERWVINADYSLQVIKSGLDQIRKSPAYQDYYNFSIFKI